MVAVESAYENWISTRKPPLFGTEPDARVWMLANEAPDPTRYRVLDIGGGTGRNTLALVRRGHPVDVVEMTSQFAAVIRAEAVFELATQCLAGGGRLVFNAFLAKPDYTPDSAARALGQQCYTTIFTPQELVSAASGLPLQLVSDDAVYDYEMAHLPEGAWPPTSWYADWVSGRDVFDLPRDECPIEMRWLVYQKRT